MAFGKRKLLAAFLEKDNLKLLSYDVFGSRAIRVFAGQITFSSEVLRDAYIADSVKFAGQLKIAFNQKDILREVAEVVLFLPPDKAFTKSLPVNDPVDGFVQALPYFKEELILGEEQIAARSKQLEKVTHVAFEKKLVEDFERPFLESGKKVVAVKSLVNVLAARFVEPGDYFVLVPTEKEIAVAVVSSGAILEMATFGKDVFLTRFGEYIVNHDLGKINQAYTIGAFDTQLAKELRSTRNLEVTALVTGDVYDEIVLAYLKGSAKGLAGNLLGMADLSRFSGVILGKRGLFLGLALVVGAVLVFLLTRNFRAGVQKREGEVKSPVVTTLAPPAPAQEPKASDFKVRVLNGTLVEGEAGRLGTKLTDLGFDVVEKKNATTAGFVATRLRAAADVPAKIVDLAKTVLTDAYETVNQEALASDSAGVKIEVIIGKKKS